MVSKEKILEKVRSAIRQTKPLTEQSYDKKEAEFPAITTSLTDAFVKAIRAVNAEATICDTEQHKYETIGQFLESKQIKNLYCQDAFLQQKLKAYSIDYKSNKNDFENMEAAITTAEFFIARTGSVLVSAANTAGRQLNIFPPVHIVIGTQNQLVAEISDAFSSLREKYKNNLPSLIELITGPSRTADIEKTLVLGAHGPKELHVFLIKDD